MNAKRERCRRRSGVHGWDERQKREEQEEKWRS